MIDVDDDTVIFDQSEESEPLKPQKPMAERREEEIEKAVQTDLLKGERRDTLCGMSIMPITFETVIFLKEFNSELISGKSFEEIKNMPLEVAKFFAIQTCENVDEAIDLIFEGERALLKKALIISRSFKPNETATIIQETLTAIRKASETQVKAVAPESKNKKGKGPTPKKG